MDSLLPTLEPGTWQADIHVGVMFYNFMLDPAIHPFCGVDIHSYLSNSASPLLSWVSWSRCVMGLKPSPYSCVQMQALVEEVIRGDHTKPE
jgi:hypothetical protein